MDTTYIKLSSRYLKMTIARMIPEHFNWYWLNWIGSFSERRAIIEANGDMGIGQTKTEIAPGEVGVRPLKQ